MNFRIGCNRFALWLVLAWLGLGSGCSALRHNGFWRPPELASRLRTPAFRQFATQHPGSPLVRAETEYANGLEAAEVGDPGCVDYFARAALAAWEALEPQLASRGTWSGRSGELYHSALLGLVNEGVRYRRLDPQQGLRVQTEDGWQTIPIVEHGSGSSPRSIQQLFAVGEYQTRHLNHAYGCPGLGLPAIGVHCRQPDEWYFRRQHPLPVTVVLRTTTADDRASCEPVLELFDPVEMSEIEVQGKAVPMARDLSAPIAYALIFAQRNYVREFLQPGRTNPAEEGLFLLRPYERGKIPIVLSHGLISDRFTWANVANEFFARPDLVARYQLWGFEYPTGGEFLGSAALLRRQLEEACQSFDPQGTDPALSNIVLVGHSMGGLITRLQISYSGDALWNAIANRPLDAVRLDPAARQKFLETCYFEPSPRVTRAIFLGTPHQGSAWAQRCIGRLGSVLVREPEPQRQAHDQLVAANPGVFSEEFRRRIPTSIDLLEPSSPLLQATNCLPIREDVATHSIIGTGYWMPGYGDSDSVVPVQSAQLARGGTEFYLHAKHTRLTQASLSIAELFRILAEHLAVVGDLPTPVSAPADAGGEWLERAALRAAAAAPPRSGASLTAQSAQGKAPVSVENAGWRAAHALHPK